MTVHLMRNIISLKFRQNQVINISLLKYNDIAAALISLSMSKDQPGSENGMIAINRRK